MRWIIVFVLLFSGCLQASDTLVILHTNDSHSHLVAFGPEDETGKGIYGGMDRLSTLIQEERRSSTNSLILHAGDFFLGGIMFNCFSGVEELRLIHRLGFEALTIGNHEFDRGPERLYNTLIEAESTEEFHYLSANMDASRFPELAELVEPFYIKDFPHFRVGIFGLTTQETNYISSPSPVLFTDPVTSAENMVDTLSSRGCDLIILLSHLGVAGDRRVAEAVSGIQIIVGGHDHYLFTTPIPVQNPEGDTTYILQVGCYNRYLGELTIELGEENRILDYEVIPVDSSVYPDPAISSSLDSIIEILESIPTLAGMYTTPLIYVPEAIPDTSRIDGYLDTPLGNLVTDALKKTSDIDVALETSESVRQGIYPGILYGYELFSTIPIGLDSSTYLTSRIIRMYISGNSLYRLLNLPLSLGNLLIYISGGRYTVYNSGSSFSVRRDSVLVNGEPLLDAATYSVVISQFFYEMLPSLYIFPDSADTLPITEFEAVRDYIIEHPERALSAATEGRIILEETGIEEKPEEKSSSLSIYPNPFNSTLSIKTGTNRDILIFNIKGELIRRLPAENHTWDGKDNSGNRLSSGVYLVKEDIPNSKPQKAVLIR
ncbi:MAG: hypothetical protein B6D65_05060 [candidate division Zixibacteria bacterium 4484_93]|nr:MAG: hypothetical protein B6D65_05060 [candidate division Zixibacteria bacterium 4484_93]